MAQRYLPLRPPPETWGTPPSPIPPLGTKGRNCGFSPLETPLGEKNGAAAPAFGNHPRRLDEGSGPLPLETPLRMGSGSGKREAIVKSPSVLRPDECQPANAGKYLDYLRIFSAASRRFLDLPGSPYRSLLRMDELTQACQLIPKRFFFCTASGTFSF